MTNAERRGTATVEETIERVFKPIQQFTRGWMLNPATEEWGRTNLGLDRPRQFWIVGRAGVMGNCTAEVAAGELAFHSLEHVVDAWEHLPPGLDPQTVAEHYAGRVVEWGDRVISTFDPDRMERLELLGRRIIDAAPASLGGVFAGWRAVPIPKTLGGRVAMTTQVLREMRGAAHINAVLAVGLSPVEAILASTNAPPRTGPEWAERMGFTGPFRDPEEVRPQRLEAEEITARILVPSFQALDGRELAEFGELVETTRDAIDM